jgi:hypothetical protein
MQPTGRHSAVLVSDLTAGGSPTQERRYLYDPSGQTTAYYDCPGGTPCLPPAGQIAIASGSFNDYSYTGYDGTCTGNLCSSYPTAPCNQPGVICLDATITSNLGYNLSSPIARFIQGPDDIAYSQVISCLTDATNTFGQCNPAVADSWGSHNADKVTKVIPADSPFSTTNCAYCYGNASKVAGQPAYFDTLVPGFSSALTSINHDVLAFQMSNDSGLTGILDLIYIKPYFNAPTDPAPDIQLANGGVATSCAKGGVTTMTLNLTAAGAPAECNAMSCPVSGTLPAGASLAVGATAVTTVSSWSDTQVIATVPAGFVSGSTVTLTTAAGDIAVTTSSINACPPPGPATQYVISATPTTVTAGSTPNVTAVTVTALDAGGQVAVGYVGTVTFSSDDPAAVLPGPYTFVAGDNGTHTFTGAFTLETVGVRHLTVADQAAMLPSASTAVTVTSGAAATFSLTPATMTTTAGNAFNITVKALDAVGNVATGYAGTVHLTSSDGSAQLAANTTLSNGLGTLSVTLNTVGAGTQTVSANDTVFTSVTGTSPAITVTPGAATTLTLSAGSGQTAGTPFNLTVKAVDAHGNTATGYTGTVYFTCTDGAAVMPANTTLPGGVKVVSVTLHSSGTQVITGTDTVTSSITGGASVNVAAAAAQSFTVSAPSSATAGSAFSVTVTALDSLGNTATGYGGTVHFTSSDGAAVLPANSTLTNGTGTFSVTLSTGGSQSVVATDTVNATITGQALVMVPGGATHFSLTPSPGAITAGGSSSVTIKALDAGGNLVTSYAGTVALTSSDPQFVAPANFTLASGQKIVPVTLATAGSQTVTATDTVSSPVTGSTSITVTAGPASKFVFNVSSPQTAGKSFAVPTRVTDAFGNQITSYTKSVTFTSSDAKATWSPSNVVIFSGGAGVVTATLNTAGTQTITANDLTINTTTPVTVVAGAIASFTVTNSPTTVTAGGTTTATVTAKDASGNTVTAYTGTVNVTTSDATGSVSPASSTLTSGVGTFTVTLKTKGTATVTAKDSVNAAITGTSASVTVNAAALDHLTLTPTTLAIAAGTAQTVTVRGFDVYGNQTGTDTIQMTSTDPTYSASAALAAGVHSFNVTLKTAGTQTITATDTTNGAILPVTSSPITVSPAAVKNLVVVAPGSVTHGVPFSITVTATDAFGNTATSYAGTVHFASTDGAAVLPADSTLTNGEGTFSVTLNTTGNKKVTVSDTVTNSLKGSSGTIKVN